MQITSVLFFLIVFTSCNYFNLKKENEDIIIENRLKEIKKNGLELYPEIQPCKTLEGRKCFEKQLTIKLKEELEQVVTLENLNTHDTIWVSIFVSNKGIITLKQIKDSEDKTITKSIENILKNLSPIKAGTINGTPVNCNFKVPLILKINN